MTFSETAAKWKSCVMDHISDPISCMCDFLLLCCVFYGLLAVLLLYYGPDGIPNFWAYIMLGIWFLLGIWILFILYSFGKMNERIYSILRRLQK